MFRTPSLIASGPILGLILSVLPAAAQQASSGTSKNLDFYKNPYDVVLPAGKTTADIRAMAIAGTNDHIYTWYDDGTVSEGISSDLDFYQTPQSFELPTGRSAQNLVAAGIAGNNNIYYYWDDGKVSKGTSKKLDFYFTPKSVSFPSGRSAADLRGIGIAGSNDHVYAWFADGTVSAGSSQDLDAHRSPAAFSLPSGFGTEDLAGIGIAGSNDRVYAWYHAESFGKSYWTLEDQVDALVLDFIEDNQLPGMTVAVSKEGHMVLNKGYGSADLAAGTPMEPYHRARIGSVSKVITALGVMHLAQEIDKDEGDQDWSFLTQPIYGTWGLLAPSEYPELSSDQLMGMRRNTPVVGTAIRKDNDHVYTWYDDGTYSSGKSSDLDSHFAGSTYDLPDNRTPRDIRAIAMDQNLQVHIWYVDGSLSIGFPWDLDATDYIDADADGVTGVDLPAGQNFDDLLGIGIAGSDGRVYSWYEDGTKSVGTPQDLDFFSQNQPYDVAPGQTPYEIRSMAISSSDRVYAFYGDNTVSAGSSWELDSERSLYATSLAAGVQPQFWTWWYGTMNLQNLLSHTAGFYRDASASGAAEMFGGSVKTLGFAKLHRYMLRTLPLLFEKGTSSRYSNEGMGLAGWILEQYSGTTYKQYIDTHILGPLGLQMGVIWDPLGHTDARTHTVTDSGAVPCNCTPSMNWGEQRGGLTSNAGDLVRLLLATDQRRSHPDILASATLDKMETRPYPSEAPRRALGWGTDWAGAKLSHNGKISGGMAYMAKYPTGHVLNSVNVGDINVAVVTNADADISLSGLGAAIVEATGAAAIDPLYDIY